MCLVSRVDVFACVHPECCLSFVVLELQCVLACKHAIAQALFLGVSALCIQCRALSGLVVCSVLLCMSLVLCVAFALAHTIHCTFQRLKDRIRMYRLG